MNTKRIMMLMMMSLMKTSRNSPNRKVLLIQRESTKRFALMKSCCLIYIIWQSSSIIFGQDVSFVSVNSVLLTLHPITIGCII